MRWLALCAAAQGFSNIGIVAFQKDLELHKEFRFGVARKLAGFVVTLTLAYSIHSYWALVAGTISSALVGVALSYRMHPYRPRLTFEARGELFHFSKWMLINNILIFFSHRSTDLVIGRYVGAPALGIYNVAYEISNLPTTELVFPISRAVFPGYAKMSVRLDELRQGFLDVLAVILLFVIPAGLGILVLAEPLVYVILGEKWVEAIPLIQLLSVFGVLRASVSNTGAVYMALGIPKVITFLAFLFLVLMFAALAVLVPRYGALGAAAAVLFAASVQVPISFVVVSRTLVLPAVAILQTLWRPSVAGLAMMAIVAWLERHFAGGSVDNLAQIAALVPLGATVYGAMVLGLWLLSGRPKGAETVLLTAASSTFRRAKPRESL